MVVPTDATENKIKNSFYHYLCLKKRNTTRFPLFSCSQGSALKEIKKGIPALGLKKEFPFKLMNTQCPTFLMTVLTSAKVRHIGVHVKGLVLVRIYHPLIPLPPFCLMTAASKAA
jgi:hypothetical protein